MLVTRAAGGYKFHSLHATRAEAHAWLKCKEHDGDDCEIVEVVNDDLEEFAEAVAKLTTK